MNALKKYLQDLLSKFDNQKIKDLEEKFKNYFKTKPNGFLGDIPLFVIVYLCKVVDIFLSMFSCFGNSFIEYIDSVICFSVKSITGI